MGRTSRSAARSSARLPNGSRTDCRPGVLRGDRESPRPKDWTRMPAPPREPLSALRSVRQYPCSSRWILEGSTEALAKHVAGMRCPAHRAANRGRRRSLDKTNDSGDHLLELFVGSDELCSREAVLEIANQTFRLVSQGNRADAPIVAATRIEPTNIRQQRTEWIPVLLLTEISLESCPGFPMTEHRSGR